MRKIIILSIVLFAAFIAEGQNFSVDNLLTIASVSPAKFDSYISKRGYNLMETEQQKDTVIKLYGYKPVNVKKSKAIDSIKRYMSRFDYKDEYCYEYRTSSLFEANELKSQLKVAGFHTEGRDDSTCAQGLIFQNKDMTVTVSAKTVAEQQVYSFVLQKKTFPKAKEIFFAEDLEAFTSHEFLKFYFGEKNVTKDICYLPGKSGQVCSVLFFNTDRQAIFIWEDALNMRKPACLVLGGYQLLKSSEDIDHYVGLNNWQLKDGIKGGMTLYQIRDLNQADFTINAGKSACPGLLSKINSGKLDFKNEDIVLGCMNCQEGNFKNEQTVSADDAMTDEKILFISHIVIYPTATEKNEVQ